MQNEPLTPGDLPQNDQTILLVEDDNLTASMLEYLFTRRGYQVQIDRDGQAAQARIASSEALPDIVLLDLMLPYVDGYEILQTIRKSPTWAQTPVLILSGKSQEGDIVRAFTLGASDYVVKPFRPNELIARVAHLANRNKLK